MIDGKIVLDECRITTVNEKALLEEAVERAKAIVERSGLDRNTTPVTTTLYD
jgi:uncharacterized protein YqgV (UPF0045/DUF77 family)